ncbi:2846_t:CDS:2 [Gigaspora margarita]|uniref:2846_t:CDS:1 n=1 Tax=Gigaspora margarita TaxID=4874 RepID=A0ABM8VVU3_GIGMA|nr:2846_t:CDS:2 [Gigaspora margarita]
MYGVFGGSEISTHEHREQIVKKPSPSLQDLIERTEMNRCKARSL